MDVYLAGPISGLSYGGAVDWRSEVAATLAEHGVTAWSPMRAKGYLAQEQALRTEGYDKSVSVLSTPRGITTRDRWDCQRADVMLANLLGAERVSIGTILEFAWADAARVPIVAAMEPGNVHEHAMVDELLGFRVLTLEEALDVVVALGTP
jgi:nucleoside 2-deoxyribosyltransferase